MKGFKDLGTRQRQGHVNNQNLNKGMIKEMKTWKKASKEYE